MYSFAKVNMSTGYFTAMPTIGFGSFVVKICIPETSDYDVIEDFVSKWFEMNMKNIEKWELVDASLLIGASNNFTEVSFDEDSYGHRFSIYIDESFTSKEPVLTTVERYSTNTSYNISLPDWSESFNEKKCSFNNEELSVISTALINLINTVGNAKTLIPDPECQKTISNTVNKYKLLNDKVCSMMIND